MNKMETLKYILDIISSYSYENCTTMDELISEVCNNIDYEIKLEEYRREKLMSNKTLTELIEVIEYCGCEVYNQPDWEKALNEIKNRINNGTIVEK